MRRARLTAVLFALLLLAAPLAADEQGDLRTDIRVEEGRIGRLTEEIAVLDGDLKRLRIAHEAAGHPRIVLTEHQTSVAALDRKVEQAAAARTEAERRAGWSDSGLGYLASLALYLSLSEERSWRGGDLKETRLALEGARRERKAADGAFEQRLQQGIRVRPVDPGDWAEYPLGRPNDVFAPSLAALERMAVEGDLRQAALAQEMALLAALRREREARLREAEDRLRRLRMQERGIAVAPPATDRNGPAVRPPPVAPEPGPPPTDVLVARYQGGVEPAFRAAMEAGWREACRRGDSTPLDDSVKSTTLTMEVRRTAEGDVATLTDGRLTMRFASRGRYTGHGTFEAHFVFEPGRAEAGGVFRGKVTATATAKGEDTGQPFEWETHTSTGTWTAKPTPEGGYTLHFEGDTVAAFRLQRAGP